MPAQENKDFTHRFLAEVMDKRNPVALDDFVAANHVEHSPMPGMAPGLEGMKQMIGMIFNAFPDIRLNVEDVIAEGDKVVMRVKTEGTTKGSSWASPPPATKSPLKRFISFASTAERWWSTGA